MRSTIVSWRNSSASHLCHASLTTRLLRPKTTYFGRIVSDSVWSKHQMFFRNGYASFSIARRLGMILMRMSTPMKNGNLHQTSQGDGKRNSRQQIVYWQIIWSDEFGTFI